MILHVPEGNTCYKRSFSQDYVYIQKTPDETISNVDVNKEDIYLPDFHYDSIGYHIDGFAFLLPNSDYKNKNLLTPKNN